MLLLSGAGSITNVNANIKHNNIRFSSRTVEKNHSYNYTKRCKRLLLRKARHKIQYYNHKYHYYQHKYKPVDKALDPVYDDNTSYSRMLYKKSGYYYGKMIHYDNLRGDWSDVAYGAKHYSLKSASSRHLLRELYRYGVSNHNDELLEYLDFCEMYHSEPKSNHNAWIHQLESYIYNQ